MPSSQRGVLFAERGCLVVLCAWLLWLPLPFGSVIPQARLPLILVPLAICAVAALLRLYATRDRMNTAQPTVPLLIWGNGALLFLLVPLLQLIPLPQATLTALSPESHAIWTRASRLASFVYAQSNLLYPITVDPRATALELFRLGAIYAAFLAAAFLVRSGQRRIALASVLCVAALFETFYGVREAALQRYAIWGWVNRLVFDRVTGTFVNPNHFAHYLAIVLPMALFLAAIVWYRAGSPDTTFGRKVVLLFERGILFFSFALLGALACVAAVLLAQSRGALLAISAGLLAVAAMLPGRRVRRVALAAGAGLVLIAALAVFLGSERTVRRFAPADLDTQTFAGRRIGVSAAAALWRRFPLLGTGAGTFEHVVSMEQREDLGKIHHHAHNDYAEIAATTGTIGFVIAMAVLLGGYVALVRMTFGAPAAELSWRRRAYQAAALASLTIAMVHALFDFNFFIPANPATLACIVGAAAATVDRDKRVRNQRRSADEQPRPENEHLPEGESA